MFSQMGNIFTPLRSTVGRAIPFEITLRNSSEQVKNIGLASGLETIKRNSSYETADDARLLNYLPAINSSGITETNDYVIEKNQSSLISLDTERLPFGTTDHHQSLFTSSKEPSSDYMMSRQLSMTFDVNLPSHELVGGIAFRGYPSLPYTIDKFGRTTSNYGLPREMRISISTVAQHRTPESRFIDADVHHTKQVINYSSGFHYFHVEPTLTNRFTLQLSDFPLILRKQFLSYEIRENKDISFFGLVIPYLYVFSYQEKSSYHHYVPGGVLGAIRQKSHADETLNNDPVEWRRFLNKDEEYQVYPASSIFDESNRFYNPSNIYSPPFVSSTLQTLVHFVGNKIGPGQSISVVCRQCDESLRSIAGIELKTPVSGLKASVDEENLLEQTASLPPDEIDLVNRLGVKIYELDFPTGVSPLDVHTDGIQKYKYLLANTVVNNEYFDTSVGPSKVDISTEYRDQRSIRFKRSSNQEYFEIVLTNLGETKGNVVVGSVKFLQSAHITLHSKMAHRLNVSRMHFRIIGNNLVEDYSQIGEHGFNFSIEKASGGQPINRLLSINSVSDLIQAEIGRILSNTRTRGVEFEKSTVYDPDYQHPDGTGEPTSRVFDDENEPNYQITETMDRGQFWHKSETGEKTVPEKHMISDEDLRLSEVLAHHDSAMFDGYKNTLMLDPSSDYEVFMTSEVGTHTEHIFPDSSWRAVRNYFDGISDLASFNPMGSIVPSTSQLHNFSSQFHEKYWNGIDRSSLQVTGLNNYFVSPGSFLGLPALSSGAIHPWIRHCYGLVQDGWDIVRQKIPGGGIAMDDLSLDPGPGGPDAGVPNPKFAVLFGGTGGSVSINGGAGVVGAGASIGLQSPFPGVQFTNTVGSQANVAKQSQRTAYSYSKTLNEQARQSKTVSSVVAGENKRIVERREIPGSDKKRVKGAEIMWQGELKDIILGSVALNISFAALAERGSVSSDETLKVRFGNGIGEDIEADFWFDISETEIQDDF